jgi:hypothetical protein
VVKQPSPTRGDATKGLSFSPKNWLLPNGKQFFLEGSVPALPKNFGSSGDEPSSSSAYRHTYGLLLCPTHPHKRVTLQNSLLATD